jgi:hypothetical protein
VPFEAFLGFHVIIRMGHRASLQTRSVSKQRAQINIIIKKEKKAAFGKTLDKRNTTKMNRLESAIADSIG